MLVEIPRNMTLCVVGESRDSSALLKGMLEKLGLRSVMTFERGTDLINYLRDFEPSLVFLVGDPTDMHWSSFVRTIRTDGRIGFAPLAMLRPKGGRMTPDEAQLMKFYRVADGGVWPPSIERLSSIVTSTVAEGQDQGSVTSALTAASKMYKEGMYKHARQIYENILAADPTSLVAIAGLIHTSIQDHATAWRQIEAALSLDPSNHNFKFQMMDYYVQRGENQKLKALFDDVMDEIKSDGEAFWLRQIGSIAISLRLFQFCEEVVQTMRKSHGMVVAGDPDLLLARALLGAGNLAEAQKYAKRAMAASPRKTPELLNLLGILARRTGRSSEAVAFLKEALVLSPYDFRVAYNIALALLDQHDYDGTIDFLTRALAIKQDYDKGRVKLAEVEALRARKGA